MNPELGYCWTPACENPNRSQFNANKFVELINWLPSQENIIEINYSEWRLTVRYRNAI